MNDSNPYRSPVDIRRGEWDHSLFWRVVKYCGVIALGFVLLDAVLMVRLSRDAACKNSVSKDPLIYHVEWVKNEWRKLARN